MTISKYKGGELVWRHEFPGGCTAAGCAFRRYVERLERLFFFTESGLDFKKNNLWVIIGTGDNCTKFEPAF